MKKPILLIAFLLSTISLVAQGVDRIEINGKIVVDSDDLEGITVYNTSSNRGTVTDAEGKFTLKVTLNDVIEVRALQFKDFTVTIDEKIMDSKKMTVFLVEKVNKLDEVVILPYDLTGNLMVDIESVKTFNPDLNAIYFGLANINDYDFSDDYKSEVVNIAMDKQGQNMIYGLNVVNMVGLLLKPLFKSDKHKQVVDRKDTVAKIPVGEFKDHYSTKFLVDNFHIPENKVDAFINYVESNGLDYSLLKSGKEFEFLEFISQKSQEFLASESGKN
jgi:hypothetical protein